MKITYTQTGDSILADVVGGDQQSWNHYLSDNEKWLLTNEPEACDIQIAVMASKQFIPPSPIKLPSIPITIEVRSSDIDPDKAALALTDRSALKAELAGKKEQILTAIGNLTLAKTAELATVIGDWFANETGKSVI